MLNGLLNFSFKEIAVSIALLAILLGGGLACVSSAPPDPPTTEPPAPPDMSADADMVTAPPDMAEPEPIITSLELNQSEGGTVVADCGADCSAPAGWNATVTAKAVDGYVFDSWECIGDSCQSDLSINPLNLSVTNDISLEPVFKQVAIISVQYKNDNLGQIVFDGCSVTKEDTLNNERLSSSCYVVVGETATVTALTGEGISFRSWQWCDNERFNSDTSICPLDTYTKTLIIPPHGNYRLSLSASWFHDVDWGVRIDNSVAGGEAKTNLSPIISQRRSETDGGFQSTWEISAFPQDGYAFDRWECENMVFPERDCLTTTKDIVAGQESFSITVGQHHVWEMPHESIHNIGLIQLKPIFVSSPDSVYNSVTQTEINKPNGSPLPDIIHHYAISNESTHKLDELYQKIAEYSINAWSEINPHIRFIQTTLDDPELDLNIRFVDEIVSASGRFCRGGCDETSTGVWHNANREHDDIINAVGLNVCVADVVMHEIGHFLDLGHHINPEHLMVGMNPPTTFDNKGLQIPQPIAFPSDDRVEETIRLSMLSNIFHLERASEERHSEELARLEQEFQMVCGLSTESEDSHDHDHPHSHPHP